MHDLEQRAHQLVRDWKALRQGLERVQAEQRLGHFYRMHLEVIEASLVAVPELAYCIVSDKSTPGAIDSMPATTPLLTHPQQPPSGDGFAALVRRTRQAVEDLDRDD